MITFIITNNDNNLFISKDAANSYFKHLVKNNIFLIDYKTYISNISNLNIYDLTLIYHNLKLNKSYLTCIYNKDVIVEIGSTDNLVMYGNKLLFNEFKDYLQELIVVNYSDKTPLELHYELEGKSINKSMIYKCSLFTILKYIIK